jgi:putative ubiquitin-RnfH superfamily antitoxin RatB of RatAB toxin-antitoxin module
MGSVEAPGTPGRLASATSGTSAPDSVEPRDPTTAGESAPGVGGMDPPASIVVCVVFSPRARCVETCELSLDAGASVHDAIGASGLAGRYPELDLLRQRVGVWGRRCDPGPALADGDRVELYRPLHADPMEARRARHRLLAAARRRAVPAR